MEKVTEHVETKEPRSQEGSWIVHIDNDIIQDAGKSWNRVKAWEQSAKF